MAGRRRERVAGSPRVPDPKIALRYLEKAGYATVVANDGVEVINIWNEQGPFDVVLMDCQVRSL